MCLWNYWSPISQPARPLHHDPASGAVEHDKKAVVDCGGDRRYSRTRRPRPHRLSLSGLGTEAQVLANDWVRAAGGKQEFDVASVRQNISGQPPAGDTPRSNVSLGPGNVHGSGEGFLRATNFPLLYYIEFAYKLTDYQEDFLRETAPGWITREKFNIEARTENRNVTKDQMRLMMQSLLAERFGLAVHYETRQVSVFALTPSDPE